MSRFIPSSRSSLFLIAGGLAALLLGCGERPVIVQEAHNGPLVADSGLRIVEDSVPQWQDGSPWTIAERPTLDLGAPGQTFLGVAAVLQLSDGRIVIADGSKQEVRYFDASGTLLPGAGGRGATGSEFQGLGWIGRGAADSVVAYDFITRRVTIFDGSGAYVRSVMLIAADPDAAAAPLGTFGDGSLLVRIGGPTSPFAGRLGAVLRDSASYMRFSLDGDPIAALGRFPQGETFGVRVRANDSLMPFPVPFGLTTVAALRADTMLIGTGAEFEIASIGPDGTPIRLLRAAIPRAAVTTSESEAYTAKALDRLANALRTSMDSTLVRSLKQAPFPAHKPAFGQLLVDQTGALWVSAPLTPPTPPTTWTVFTPEGKWLGTVTTPDGFRVDEIGADYLLGVLRKPNEQERVQRYPLVRAGGA